MAHCEHDICVLSAIMQACQSAHAARLAPRETTDASSAVIRKSTVSK